MWFVYVLYSEAFDKIYIGASSDVNKRLLSHNHLHNKGWTARYRPWSIILIEEYSFKQQALIRERQLKSARGRLFIRSHYFKEVSWFSPPAGG